MLRQKIIAHRGGASLYSENTLSAFRRAIALGVDEIECDIHLLKSGEVVIFHDFSLEQLVGKKGYIHEIDNETRQQLCVKGSTEAPPLLEELLDLLVSTDVALHLEIKTCGEVERETLLSQKALELIKSRCLEKRVSAISFDARSLRPFIEAGIPSGPCIDNFKGDISCCFSEWKKLGYSDLSLDSSIVSRNFIEAALDAGFTVGVWTVNGVSRLSHWLDIPVHYITTDQPDLALRLRSQK
ncbi:Glycerophosphoryl diester phosphodiesterase [Bartonella clarridgeiae 73]|uniref:Glycerophosphoryl diester phosphodiesterase n=1 Tax=Bartonella clarridgeiae (strain CCUG 45776 / CIP 104772 / 73) TaxID=696125 RepID=E6YIS8_BARC7|nr:glycerophosphodiester phosphodiesterase [Bartonella clarridgeiae]WCR54668.1 MAG: Glycerophosphoryl diester phosphodiesterase [Bartonella clarridgeiae]CBI76766.1 Glycerophosphoryl diester phosphodiesterase [Bartonella clarridgeiae 73]